MKKNGIELVIGIRKVHFEWLQSIHRMFILTELLKKNFIKSISINTPFVAQAQSFAV